MLLAGSALAGFFGLIPAAGAAAVPPEEKTALPGYNAERISPDLFKLLIGADADERFPVLVDYGPNPGLLRQLKAGKENRAGLIEAIKADAAFRSAPVRRAILESDPGGQMRLFWASPVIWLEADRGTIAALSKLPEIMQIRLDRPFRALPADFEYEPVLNQPGPNFPWHLEVIGAEQAFSSLGLDGSGVVVASLDSGVDWRHPALQRQYRGFRENGPAEHAGNWHVSTSEIYPEPTDVLGHGTHTMGTVVGDDGGDNRVGVAPGARWISVKLIDDQGFIFESWVHDALEWVMAPGGDPSLAPDIVSNSWSVGFGGDQRFQPAVAALRAAGILPVFSAGNSGPFPGSIESPSDYPESFAVGALDDVQWVTTFSGRGPSLAPWNEVKPEIAAPGIDIYSTLPGGQYGIADGTSMAAPQAAGAAAMLLQAEPGLSPGDLETKLTAAAFPLGNLVPNNDSGSGLLDVFAAGQSLVPHGVISGLISISNAPALPGGRLTAFSVENGSQIGIAVEDTGEFSLALLPGVYTLTASAFGFHPEAIGGVLVSAGSVTKHNFMLEQMAGGRVEGIVLDGKTGAPVQARIQMQNGPLVAAAGSSGRFELEVPEGVWVFQAEASAHRTDTFTATVSAGNIVSVSIALRPSPKILLVDSGRWYYGTKAYYFQDALDALGYSYDIWDIRDPFGIQTGISDAPVITDMLEYDLLVWSAPGDSPGFIRRQSDLSQYFDEGGSILLSGQDVAFWDAGGNIFILPSYFPKYYSAVYEQPSQIGAISGIPQTPFQGLNLTLNTPDSGQEQVSPDGVSVGNRLVAQDVLAWPAGETAALLSGGCRPYRAAWTGFGLEGVGPRPERLAAFDLFLTWFQTPRLPFDLYIQPVPEVLIGSPGETISRVLAIENTGVETDTFLLEIKPGSWPAALYLPGAASGVISGEIDIPGCSAQAITATVDVPAGLQRNSFDSLHITAASRSWLTVTRDVTLSLKTPAPLLFVEDGRWQLYGDRYAAALDNLGYSFDFVDTADQPLRPKNILGRYPLAVWSTGQDWFLPLLPEEREMMVAFLDGGGRLMMSSQDLVDVDPEGQLGKSYFGIGAYAAEITPTLAVGSAGSVLGGGRWAWPLSYPFVNWSDGVWPASGAEAVIFDALGRPVGIANSDGDWRSLFYSFPLETLPPGALEEVLADSLVWLGPFGGSDLSVPAAIQRGEIFQLLLSLRSGSSFPQLGLRAEVPLPSGLEPVPGSLAGPWTYDSASRLLIWKGDLYPGVEIALAAGLDSAGLPSGTNQVALEAVFLGLDSGYFVDREVLWLDVPEISLNVASSPGAFYPPAPGFQPPLTETVFFTVGAGNQGNAAASFYLTDSYPLGMTLLTDTVSVSGGNAQVMSGTIQWQGDLASGEQLQLSYQGWLKRPYAPGQWVHWALMQDGFRNWYESSLVHLFGSLFLPLLFGP